MEPKNPSPQVGPERAGGYMPSLPEAPLRVGPEQTVERSIEQRPERPAVQEQSQPSLPPPVLPTTLPIPTPVQADSTASATTASDTPLVAGDDDLIEKEWVDKAKKIIAETKDDPYRREQEVSKLQSDYLLKRYGHNLGEAA